MTKKELTVIALKFVALFILVELLTTFSFYGFGAIYTVWSWFFGTSVPELSSAHQTLLVFIGLLAIALPVATAWLLWKMGTNLATNAGEENRESVQVINSANVVIMLVGVGLWAAISAFPQLLNSAQSMIYESHYKKNISNDSIVWLIGSSLQLLIGISLILGRNGWQRIIFRLRYGSLPEPSNNSLNQDAT
jgi:hypothetical protein